MSDSFSNALTTGELELPDEILDPWLGKIRYGSSIAALSTAIPMKFGRGQAMTFDIGEAEHVGEGMNHGSSVIKPSVMRTLPQKFHKTVRWTDEVQWTDEDTRIAIVTQVLAQIQPALSRALDYGCYHSINPATGDPVAGMGTSLVAGATNVVNASTTDRPHLMLDAASALLLANDYVASGVALSPAYAGVFSSTRSLQTEQRLHPNLRLSTEPSELDGYRASVSKTVSGAPGANGNIRAIVGDFDAIRWGVQRNIGLELIRFGDPDGGGDLKRNGQVAFRATVVYGWGIADHNAFALIRQAS